MSTSNRKRSTAASLRRIAVRLHRWIGLALGLVFVVLGLSGSFNVFHRELDAWLNPTYWAASAPAVNVTPTEALALARTRYPEMKASLLGLPVDGSPYTLNFRDAALTQGAEHLQFQLAIDPATGEVAEPRVHWGGLSLTRSEFVRTLYRLHYELLAPPFGHTIVGLSGFFLVGLVILGITLWWPRNGNWRTAFSFKRSAHIVRRMFDLHRVLGAVSALILLLTAVSGSYIVFPEQFHTATAIFGKTASFPRTVTAHTPGPGTSAEAAIAIAEAQFSDAVARSVSPPSDERGTYRVRLYRAGEAHPLGRTYVWVEPATGKVLRIHDWTGQQGIQRFYAWQFPLHNGSLFGLPGRMLVFIVGFIPLLLLLSGTVIWNQKRRAQRLRRATCAANVRDGSRQSSDASAAWSRPRTIDTAPARRDACPPKLNQRDRQM